MRWASTFFIQTLHFLHYTRSLHTTIQQHAISNTTTHSQSQHRRCYRLLLWSEPAVPETFISKSRTSRWRLKPSPSPQICSQITWKSSSPNFTVHETLIATQYPNSSHSQAFPLTIWETQLLHPFQTFTILHKQSQATHLSHHCLSLHTEIISYAIHWLQ